MTSIAHASRSASLLALAAALAVTGCSSSTGSGSSGDVSAQCKTGTEAPYAKPAGTALTLPAGIAVDGDISGDVNGPCASKSITENASDLLIACIGLRNSSTSDVIVTIPAGLTLVAKKTTTQNGIIIHSHDLTVPAGTLKYFYFRPASLNQACDPSGPGDVYTIGNVTSDPKLIEVLALAKNKKVSGDIGAEAVGRMIWDITDGNGITDEHRAALASAPDLAP